MYAQVFLGAGASLYAYWWLVTAMICSHGFDHCACWAWLCLNRNLLCRHGPVCMYVCIYVCMSVYVCMQITTSSKNKFAVSRRPCMYVCLYVCLYVCMYMCASWQSLCLKRDLLCRHGPVCMRACMHVYVCMLTTAVWNDVCRVGTALYVCMYVCMYIYVHADNGSVYLKHFFVETAMYACMHVSMYLCIYVCICMHADNGSVH